MGWDGETQVDVPVADGAVPVVVRQGTGTGRALLVGPSIFGVGPDVLGQLDDLATSARVVVAPDLFWRGARDGTGAGPVPYDQMATVMGRLQALDKARAYEDFRTVVTWVADQTGNAGVVGLGVCFGGPFCFLAAADGLLDGVVTWHGSRLDGFVERAEEMRCPMDLHFGGADRLVPPSVVERMREVFFGRDDVRVTVHDGADHGYSHPDGPTFDPVATQAGMDAVRRMLSR